MAKLEFDGPAVAMQEIAIALGAVIETVEYYVRALSMKPVLDWRGDRALRLSDAHKLFMTARAAATEHSERWHAYRVWLAAKREAAAKEREAKLVAEAQERAKIRDEQRRRQAEAEALARRQAATELEAARAATGETFEQFVRETT